MHLGFLEVGVEGSWWCIFGSQSGDMETLWARGVDCIPTWTQWEMLNSEARSLFVSRALYVQIQCMYHTISRDVRVEETQRFIVNLRRSKRLAG